MDFCGEFDSLLWETFNNLFKNLYSRYCLCAFMLCNETLCIGSQYEVSTSLCPLPFFSQIITSGYVQRFFFP